ncbi:glycosyltransferase [Sphingobacterium thalpophilum]|uniref:Glycosyltransferase n=1 Tax=Sphingobacterium thalpophilum TaxID=259 RepID=A0ABV4H8K4_9SPHI
MENKAKLVVSAINFFEGGPLSVLKDCLRFLNKSNHAVRFQIFALVHRKDLFDHQEFGNIIFVEFPKSRESYFYRLYYEYFYFKNFSRKNNVIFWLSLHDITPRLNGIQQAVYCHNPSPFREVKVRNFMKNPTEFLFNLFYKYLYRINIKSNKYIIVQQQWIRDRFSSMFSLDKNRIVVATPDINEKGDIDLVRHSKIQCDKKTFIYPTLSRTFKNIEVIGEAVKYINGIGDFDFKIYITIDGSENRYAESIVEKYKQYKQLAFIGKIDRMMVYDYYSQVSALLFPSTLETWGMPITEFKRFKKPIIVSDLPYAKETVNDYDKAIFFDPMDFKSLAHILIKIIEGRGISYYPTKKLMYEEPHAENWKSLFDLLLN